MKSPNLYNAKKRGFTLIEIVVVIALVGIIAAMGTVVGFDALSRSNVHEERDLLVTLLTGQRAKALANINELDHGVHIDQDAHEYTLIGSNPNTIDSDEALTIDIDGNSQGEVVFEQLSGNTSCDPVCTITVSDGAKSQIIEVNKVGRIEW
jgi:prepilin-type N-terminal cleavage/methylation domain-containing protein